MHLTDSDFERPLTTVSILKKGIHGGFISKTDLSKEEKHYCNQANWIEQVVKFECEECGSMHTTRPSERICLTYDKDVSPDDEVFGYRKQPQCDLNIKSDTDYSIFIKEHSKTVDTNSLPYKSVVFVKNADEVQFSDRAGSIVFLPFEYISKLINHTSNPTIIDRIQEKRKRLVEWDALDDGGKEFEEIIYRLIKRSDDFFDSSWGGSGTDQGKEAFCSISLGGRTTRILVQAKFNNKGKAISDQVVGRYCRKASRHDCRGLIMAAVRTSGDLESEFETRGFHTQNLHFFQMWAGPDIKEKLSEHPDLISEYFLN